MKYEVILSHTHGCHVRLAKSAKLLIHIRQQLRHMTVHHPVRGAYTATDAISQRLDWNRLLTAEYTAYLLWSGDNDTTRNDHDKDSKVTAKTNRTKVAKQQQK